ncbi:MAG: 2-hydroxyacyl-CoA dehydratase family protein [Planctomycetaceae bacterium]|nr:2-hydroxyacyl-CoA dehydratase family protein [Planctomycetaceae bacterium]
MKTVAYSSPFVPPEWIAAHGLHPHRLIPRAATHIPRGVCPFAGAIVAEVLAGLDIDAMALTTACDQMRYAAAMLETERACPTVFLLNVPSTWQTAAVRRMYFNELQRLGRFLVTLGGTAPDAAALAASMRDYERQRKCAAERSPGKGVPLAVLGGPMMDSECDFFELVDQAGGRVVLDATDGAVRTQPRAFVADRVDREPLRELAEAYFDGIADVFRRPNHRFYDWLARETADHGASGIVVRRYVWCDLWHAETPRIRERTGLPVLEIDVGADDVDVACRTRGRLEAFVETLR